MRFVLSQTIIAVTEKGENDMPRYIDAETALKIIDNYAKTVTADGIVVVKAIRDIVEIITPTADVVPKSEVESIFDELIKQAGEIAENYKKEDIIFLKHLLQLDVLNSIKQQVKKKF